MPSPLSNHRPHQQQRASLLPSSQAQQAQRQPPPELERRSVKIQFMTTPSIARRARAVAYWTYHRSLAALLEHALLTEIERAEAKHGGPFVDVPLPRGRRPRRPPRGSLTDMRDDA
ncbi:MAG: hypothetical protein N3A02_05545 [Rectinema sp.]|nr:hypothetical protein [Rectinema sp.]